MTHVPAAGPAERRFHDRLAELVLATDGLTPPCLGRDEWISEDDADRVQAVQACGWCVLLDDCAAVAGELRPVAGVWAGGDFTALDLQRVAEVRRAVKQRKRASCLSTGSAAPSANQPQRHRNRPDPVGPRSSRLRHRWSPGPATRVALITIPSIRAAGAAQLVTPTVIDTAATREPSRHGATGSTTSEESNDD